MMKKGIVFGLLLLGGLAALCLGLANWTAVPQSSSCQVAVLENPHTWDATAMGTREAVYAIATSPPHAGKVMVLASDPPRYFSEVRVITPMAASVFTSTGPPTNLLVAGCVSQSATAPPIYGVETKTGGVMKIGVAARGLLVT